MTMVISGSDGVTFPDSTNQFSGGAFSFKNRILNGDMRIDQRNAGAAVTVNSTAQTLCADRWFATGQSTDGVFTMAQSTNAPTGFSNSLQISVTTADASIGATQRYYIAQRIEAFNTADLSWGTANAKTVTLSFWVRSSLTGTFGGFIYNSDANYTYPFSYSISVADTWEYKTVTVSGPTAGTWLGSTNGIGVQIGWSMGAGTDRLAAAGSWAAAQYFGATGQVNPIGTLNATFYITGVQLEVGSVATPFERRPYGTELALCQRYCVVYGGNAFSVFSVMGFGGNSTTAVVATPLPVEMRALPSISYTGNTRLNPDNIAITSVVFNTSNSTNKIAVVEPTAASGLTTNRGYFWTASNDASARAIFSAEL